VQNLERRSLRVFPRLSPASLHDRRCAAIISKRVPESSVRVVMHALRGGLESMVARARFSSRVCARFIPTHLVTKTIPPSDTRAAQTYGALWRCLDVPPTVRDVSGKSVTGDVR
jgi:hypothetical protein